MDSSINWEHFIYERLVQFGAISGVCLVSHQGLCLYSMGLLQDFRKTCDENRKMLNLFNTSRDKKTSQFDMYVTGQGSISFQVHQQTNCSLYAVSGGSHIGLLIGNLPHGILVCTYTHREPEIGRAKKQFEEVCHLLRS